MNTAPEMDEMAKKIGRPKRSERDDVTMKMDRALAGMVKAVALSRGIPAAELTSEMIRPLIGKAYAQMLNDLGGELPKPKAKGKEPK